jgi:hypothetical protein
MRTVSTWCVDCGSAYANPTTSLCLSCSAKTGDAVCRSCEKTKDVEELMHYGGRCNDCTELEIGRLDALWQQWRRDNG